MTKFSSEFQHCVITRQLGYSTVLITKAVANSQTSSMFSSFWDYLNPGLSTDMYFTLKDTKGKSPVWQYTKKNQCTIIFQMLSAGGKIQHIYNIQYSKFLIWGFDRLLIMNVLETYTCIIVHQKTDIKVIISKKRYIQVPSSKRHVGLSK